MAPRRGPGKVEGFPLRLELQARDASSPTSPDPVRPDLSQELQPFLLFRDDRDQPRSWQVTYGKGFGPPAQSAHLMGG